MDVSAVSSSTAPVADLQGSVAVSVLRRTLDMEKTQGEQMVRLIDQSGAVGGKLNLLA